MKARINHDGTLVIQSESGLEAYALKRWSEDRTLDPDILCKFSVPELYPDCNEKEAHE